MKIQLSHKFNEIISINNLLEAWKEFEKGKRAKKDVQEFFLNLMNNIFSLHRDLSYYTYIHGDYQAFKINDPKPRNIHKAEVRDRLLHHAVYRMLYPFFDRTFIADSYSCRLGKGTHRAVNRLDCFTRKVSKNNTRACYVLKCDIRKFFASINHKVLINILAEYIPDQNILWLLKKIIFSFNTKQGAGLPLGNLTSQLFANVYMNKFDQFMKHRLKIKKYIRYADDFVIIDSVSQRLKELIKPIRRYLREELKLMLHPDKIIIRKHHQGIDFLGYVVLTHHRVLRTKTKKRMFRNIKNRHKEMQGGIIAKESFHQSLQSYFGILKHCKGYSIEKQIIDKYVD